MINILSLNSFMYRYQEQTPRDKWYISDYWEAPYYRVMSFQEDSEKARVQWRRNGANEPYEAEQAKRASNSVFDEPLTDLKTHRAAKNIGFFKACHANILNEENNWYEALFPL
jgi:hypothetical protein